jgi:predicted nuclease of restriction endonuclease-like (RecB) superfamily
MENEKTNVVKIHDVHIDQEYVQWLSDIKARYRNSQIKAAVRVNTEQLRFNWQLGRDLVIRKAEERWGAGVVEQISLDLQAEFPESKGFSTTNLWYMKQWYRFYAENRQKLQQLVGEIQATDNQINEKLSQVVREIQEPTLTINDGVPFPAFFSLVPWGHHLAIISKSKSIEEALFYISKTISGSWSRNTLLNCIKADLFHTSGGAITNFADKLPAPQSELAQAITKDTYDFGFLSLEEGYKEEALETELENHLTHFLLELGTGFAYLGRQREIIVSGKTRRIDMLFYHIRLRCYIVIELKATPFQPEYAGKLNFYVNAVNHLMKTPEDNPTIGLLICSNKDKTEVQYAFESVQNPMGVASYTNIQIKEIQKQLPSVEELKERIRFIHMLGEDISHA